MRGLRFDTVPLVAAQRSYPPTQSLSSGRTAIVNIEEVENVAERA